MSIHDDTLPVGSHAGSNRLVSAPTPSGSDGARRSVVFKTAARLLMDSLGYESTLAAVAGLALPEVGSWSIVDLCDRSGAPRRLGIVHPNVEMQESARRLADSWPPRTDDPIGAPLARRTRETQVVATVSDAMLVEVARGDENLALLRELGFGSFLVVPLEAHRQVLGAITFVSRKRGRTYTEDDIGLAEDLATLGALAIERAHRYEETQTERALATERANLAERQHFELKRVMGVQARLVRGFSHDVKNPLGAALGYALLLEDEISDSLTTGQRRSVMRIGASIQSALALIDDLVGYAVSTTGTMTIERAPTHIGEVAGEIVEEHRAQIEAAGLHVAFDVPPGLQPISSDRARIRQILGNLLSNAWKYTDVGGVSVRVEHCPSGTTPWPGAWIAVAVADTGRGIPPREQSFVFQEFARLAPATTEGTGLGLAISARLAEALGARITLTSAVGKGSTFTLWLPDGACGQRPK